MIRATARLLKPDDALLSIELTMSVGEARALAEQQEAKWPSSELSRALRGVLHAAIDRVDKSHDL